MDGDRVRSRRPYLGLGDLPTLHRRGPCDDSYRPWPLEYMRAKTDRCKRLERWAQRLQEFTFTIQPRPGAQQKHGDALSRAPVLAEPNHHLIVLDEFPERVVLLVRSWDERVVAWPTRDGLDGPKRGGRECTPCMAVQRLAERAQAQRRGLRRRRAVAPRVAQVQQVDAASCEEADDDGCHVLLTDGEERDDADAVLIVT